MKSSVYIFLKDKSPRIFPLAVLAIITVLSGCDYSAKSDLRAMDKAMKDAEENNADQWAETEFKKAQAAFGEAQDLARNREINKARDKAVEAKGWADEALELTLKRKAEMEAEKDRLGTYTP